jgi:hypothetical protein
LRSGALIGRAGVTDPQRPEKIASRDALLVGAEDLLRSAQAEQLRLELDDLGGSRARQPSRSRRCGRLVEAWGRE